MQFSIMGLVIPLALEMLVEGGVLYLIFTDINSVYVLELLFGYAGCYNYLLCDETILFKIKQVKFAIQKFLILKLYCDIMGKD